MNIKEILDQVPDYSAFYTTDELAAAGEKLAARFPGVVERFSAGESKNGEKLWCLKIGTGKKNALCFACPHPNEPIGAMTLITLAEILADDAGLLEETGMTWYLIPCIDPDGVRLNESWFKGPFSIENYARGFFRPTGSMQVEWTFPFKYQGYVFDKPIPETRALMGLVDRLRPSFVFSLHNNAFGGAYWYITRNIPELNADLEAAASRQGVQLHLGEPESPYITKYSKAVHSMMSMLEYFDYMEERDPGALIARGLDCGTCSADYINSVCDCLTLIAEIPYFQAHGIDDETPLDITRRESAINKAERQNSHFGYMKTMWGKVRSLFGEDNQFPLLADGSVKAYNPDGYSKSRFDGEEYSRAATAAEELDNRYLSMLLEMLELSLAIRACDMELARKEKFTDDQVLALEQARRETEERLSAQCLFLETNCEYTVTPIKNLVSVQLESALKAILYC